MDKFLYEVKSVKNNLFRGLSMVGVLFLAFVLGVLSLTGTDDFLD